MVGTLIGNVKYESKKLEVELGEKNITCLLVNHMKVILKVRKQICREKNKIEQKAKSSHS